MAKRNAFMERWGFDQPIIQAPMAGGGDTPELVAAVCEAGGVGFLGVAYLTPEKILEAAKAVRARTQRPFGINLFAPMPQPPPQDAARAVQAVARFYGELGLGAPEPPKWSADPFAQQLPAVLESGAALFSFTFGLIPAEALRELKRRGIGVLGTATTVAEALALQEAGVDAVVAQGAEAGGHRGTFAGPFESSLVGTMALAPQVVDAATVPVVASGGIMDGRGVAAALALGASAVQMGTAFLACDEAGAPEAYKRAMTAAVESETRVTRAFSGRAARGIVNRFMAEMDAQPEAILPFPLQNTLTRPMRTAAAKAGKADYLSLWSGQGVRMARRQPAAALMQHLKEEAAAAAERLR